MKAYAVPFEKFVNLADARLGTKIISVTDDWFADANRLFQPTPAVWKEGVFDDNGKWMDGWESRRKRFEGYDSAVIRLGVPGSIKGVDIDTSFFTGNFPPSASLEACFLASGEPDENTQWTEVLSAVELQANSHHYHEISNDQAFSHLRFNIYPDGGVARLRVYGIPFRDWSAVGDNEQVDLAAALNGGRALACSDEHFGRMSNILNPGRGINMGDGWETARRRTPGNDWVIVALGHPGEIEKSSSTPCTSRATTRTPARSRAPSSRAAPTARSKPSRCSGANCCRARSWKCTPNTPSPSRSRHWARSPTSA
jgi:allantoicase